jgi:hypothetical protein
MRNSDTSQQQKQSRQHKQVVTKAVRNRDRTRQSLLRQGRKLARRRATNVEHAREDEDESDSSTIVSGHSTVPPVDSNERAAARHSHSTVPSRPKGSTVPAAPRLYGLDLHAQLRSGAESGDETRPAADNSEATSTGDAPGATEEVSER